MQPVVEVDVSVAQSELAADRLWQLGVSAIEERRGLDTGAVTLAAGVDARDVERVVTALPAEWQVRVVEVDEAGWADRWKQWATDVRAGDRLRIHPAWLPESQAEGSVPSGEVVIALDPGRAFGSGTHPTTRLVLSQLEQHLRFGDRVLDVGSGSGVLSVAAALLGAAAVTAVDIDHEATRATRENAAINGVTAVVHTVLGDVTAVEGLFDLVLVNIGASAIVGAAAELTARTAPGGVLVAAGFLAERAAPVAAAFPMFISEAEVNDGEWSALVLRHRRTS